ncbi:MAG: hypothetical protein KAR42_05245 [candidate division Zixibacteria bacterium]|nr:hypothetical protein [candidate division Zixibacteria bacterium]
MKSKLLSDLYTKLTGQSEVVLNKDSLSETITEQWKTLLNSESFKVSSATFSKPDEIGNFTLHGTSELMKFSTQKLDFDFFVSYEESNEETEALQCIIRPANQFTSWNLKQDFPDMPGYVDYSEDKEAEGLQESFLKLIEFKDLTFCFSSYDFSQNGSTGKSTSYTGDKSIDGEIIKEGINFDAQIETEAPFWHTVQQITGSLGRISLFAHIMDNSGAISLEAGCSLNAVFVISDPFKVNIKKLMISSGLGKESKVSPTLSIFSEIDGFTPALELEIDTGINRPWIRFSGFFKDSKVMTIPDLLKSLGMESLDVTSLLPVDPKTGKAYIFGDVGLKDFNLEMDIVPPNVDEFDFTITTEHPWIIINDIISVQPLLQVKLTDPFKKETREAWIEILGKWELGKEKTQFYVYALPLSGDVTAAMKDGETLSVDALTEQLLPGISFPKVELTDMEFIANFLAPEYHIRLAAKTELAFEFGSCKIGLTEVGFTCYYGNGKLQQLQLRSSFCLAGLPLDIDGEYHSTNGLTLHGGMRPDTDINFKTVFNDLITDLGMPEAKLPASIPDISTTVTIGAMYINYQSKDQDFVAFIDLINVFDIPKIFAIDEVAMQLHFNNTGVQDAFMKFKLTLLSSIHILLELKYVKEKSKWMFIGGTDKDTEIHIGKLFEHLIGAFGVEGAVLPKMITEFVVKDIQIMFSTSSDGQEFSFSCKGVMPIDSKHHLDLTVGLHFSKKKESGYEFDIEGKVQIDTLTFQIDFEHKKNENILAAVAKEDPPLNIVLHDLISKLSTDAGEIIPTSLTINLQDAFFILAKQSEEQNAPLNILIGIDIGASYDISDFPVIGSLFEHGTKIGVDDLQAVVCTKPVSKTLYADIQKVLEKSKTKLQPESMEYTGLYISAILNLIEVKPKLVLPIVKKPPQPSNALMPMAMTVRDQSTSDSQKIHWNNINKTVGPIQLRRVGVGLQSKKEGEKTTSKLTFAIDISLVVSGLELDLIGVWIAINVNEPFKHIPSFGLHGINVAYSQPPLEFNAGLLYEELDQEDYAWEINGQLIIKYAEYGFFGVASYAQPTDKNWIFKDVPILPSFFAFLMVSAPIGGPPYIYLSGLAGGFGFNRYLKIPQANEVLDFPLVQGALEPDDFKAGHKADTALTAMNDWVPPKPYDFWLAIGVSVGSCHILNVFAMVAGVFGTDFELSIIGLATADIPAEESPEKLAHLQLALVGHFNPLHGIIEITGALTSTSYLFVPQCKLTGGFAYCMWMEKAMFLVSIGGYSPAFKKLDYFPTLEHVGINWKFSDYLMIKGGVYFAYTPSCAMAGGELNIDFNLDVIHAWLTAHADFLLEWLPFHYDISIGVSIGVAVKIHLLFVHKTLKLEVGADLHLWGPDFAGEAKVHLWIVSFTIGFGANANKKPPRLTWDKFFDNLVAGDQKTSKHPSASNAPEKPSICTISIKEGLIKGNRQKGKTDYWIVNPDRFVIETKSTIPSNDLHFNTNQIKPDASCTTIFGIRPMGKTNMKSDHIVHLEKMQEVGTWKSVDTDQLEQDIHTGNLPEANWANSPLQKPDAATVSNVPVGLILTSKPKPYYVLPPTGEVDTGIFMYDPMSLKFKWDTRESPINPTDRDPAFKKIHDTVMADPAKTRRSKLLDELNQQDFNLITRISLTTLADNVQNLMQSEPQLYKLGAVER